MQRTVKRALSLFLSAALALGLCLPALASGPSRESTEHADKLYALHLFRGTGQHPDGTPIYSLERTPTRLQGLIMLIRLLGLEEKALAYAGENPFTDVSGANAPLVAYAYRSGITNGTSPTTFTPAGNLSARNYVAFLLRALGYGESAGDFTGGRQLSFAASISLMTREAAEQLSSLTLNRGDLADLSYAALTCRLKGGHQTLAEKLRDEGVFTQAEGEAAGVLGDGSGWVYTYTPYQDPGGTVSYEKKSVSAGSVTAHVITVNTANPNVTVKSAMVDSTLGHTAPFSRIVQSSGGAVAVINGNFFASNDALKVPMGHVMVNGRFLYGDSGLSSIGITRDGQLRVGRPAVFTRLTSGTNQWAVYEINTSGQEPGTSVMYTPAYGSQVTFTTDGWALVANNGSIAEYYYVGSGAAIAIPSGGYVVFMGTAYASTDYFRIPQVGASVSMEYYLRTEDPEGFTLDGVESIISGGPRLVRDGAKVTTLDEGFDDPSRFGPGVSSPRTAAGIGKDGKLVLVSVPGGATLQQMRELMVELGCVDAINLDGGASCGMYYNGSYLATPGRELTVTLQVFVK